MTPEAIIKQSAADGVRLKLSPDGSLKATGDQRQVEKWIPTIREHKPEIVQALSETMTPAEENLILRWLLFIDETDPEIIDFVLSKCRMDVDARDYFLGRAHEIAANTRRD